MAAKRPAYSMASSIVHSKFPTQYVCRPCLLSRHQSSIINRQLHQHVKQAPVPSPTPFVPDVPTFLTLIGRNLSTHASKFSSWESLFKLSSLQLKELGIEPARSRRYLLRWRDKFRNGEFGIGGDFKYVSDGVGELRVIEVPSIQSLNGASDIDGNTNSNGSTPLSISTTPGMQKLVLNTPANTADYSALLSSGETSRDLKKPAHIKLKDGHTIIGSYLQPVKGSNGSAATLKVTEGLWEHKRGRKIFGGERRRAETLHKMRVEERKKNER